MLPLLRIVRNALFLKALLQFAIVGIIAGFPCNLRWVIWHEPPLIEHLSLIFQ